MYNAINFVLEEQELHFINWWPLYEFQGKVLPIPADARLIASLVG